MNKKPNYPLITVFKSAGRCIVILQVNMTTARNNFNRLVYDEYHAEYRCDQAYVIDIYDKLTYDSVSEVASDYDKKFIYKKGHYVYVDNYNINDDVIATTGIHVFMNDEPAYHRNLVCNKFTGVWKEWLPDGRLSREYDYVGGKIDKAKYMTYPDLILHDTSVWNKKYGKLVF